MGIKRLFGSFERKLTLEECKEVAGTHKQITKKNPLSIWSINTNCYICMAEDKWGIAMACGFMGDIRMLATSKSDIRSTIALEK